MQPNNFSLSLVSDLDKTYSDIGCFCVISECKSSAYLTYLSDEILGGDNLSHGNMFAYLFRRFGYPVRGWDDYKELVSYIFRTSHADLLMKVSPKVDCSSCVSISFLVPFDLLYGEHRDEFLSYNSFNPDDIADENPNKAFLIAAIQAIEDLKRPVSIRDDYINFLGKVDVVLPEESAFELEEDEIERLTGIVKPSTSAGYGIEALINSDPERFIKLMQKITNIGGGDFSRGADIIMEKNNAEN